MEDLKPQRAEFDAAYKLAETIRVHNLTSVVDDDYEEVRHNYESALAGFIDAMKANARFKYGNRYGLVYTARTSMSEPVEVAQPARPYTVQKLQNAIRGLRNRLDDMPGMEANDAWQVCNNVLRDPLFMIELAKRLNGPWTEDYGQHG